MKYKQLTREQRYAIYLGLKEKKTTSAIARQIGVSASTVSREVRRNTNRSGHYVFKDACELAQVRRERSCANRRIPVHVQKQALSLLVGKDWSPRQISGCLRRLGVFISHEKIYSLIREDPTGQLRAHTRHGMKHRRHVKVCKTTKATNIPNRVNIHERTAEADGTRFGNWELDLVVGKGQRSALVTLTERSTNFLLIGFVPDKRPATVAQEVWRLLVPFMGNPVKTITTDNGFEFRNHQDFVRRLKTKVYFADSYCSWQKGAIENANKLIRQYFPKGTDFNLVPIAQIRHVRHLINARPRAKLNFDTPKNRFFKLCH